MLKSFVFSGFFLLLTQLGYSYEVSNNIDKEAIAKTKAALLNPQERNKIIEKSPEAQKANNDFKSFLGSAENLENAYKLVSEILEKLAAESGGDPAVMKKRLEEAAKNPAAFASSWTSAQQEQLKNIAAKTPAAKQEAEEKASKDKKVGNSEPVVPYGIKLK